MDKEKPNIFPHYKLANMCSINKKKASSHTISDQSITQKKHPSQQFTET